MKPFNRITLAFLKHIEKAVDNTGPRRVAANNIALALATLALGRSPVHLDIGHEPFIAALETLAKKPLNVLQTAIVYQLAYAQFSPARQHQPVQCISEMSFDTYLTAIRVAADELLGIAQAQLEPELALR